MVSARNKVWEIGREQRENLDGADDLKRAFIVRARGVWSIV